MTPMPLRIFGLPNWVSHWAHPFEARLSLYHKYAWINGVSNTDYRWLIDLNKKCIEREQLEQRLNAGVPALLQAQEPDLWRTANFPLAICEACLEAGYHSVLPQMLGHSHCPLHGSALQRCCKNCFQPLYFGWPDYASGDGPFVCAVCGEGLAAFHGALSSNWREGPSELLTETFRDLSAQCAPFVREAEGIWVFPSARDSLDHRLVVHALTGNRLINEFAIPIPLLSSNAAIEQVRPITFRLPMDDSALEAEIRRWIKRMLAEVGDYCDADPDLPFPHGDPSISILKPELTYGFTHTLFSNLKSVLFSYGRMHSICEYSNARQALLQSVAVRCEALERGGATRVQLTKQIVNILLGLSIFQALRVLIILRDFSFRLVDIVEHPSEMYPDDEAVFEAQRYGIRLRSYRRGNNRIRLQIDPDAWFAPYRLQRSGLSVEMSVFQIYPLAPP